MFDFEYQNPVKVIFGRNSIERLAKEVPEKANVLMIYGGGSIKRTGVYKQVIESLDGFNISEFAGIEPNPHYETCMKAVDVVKANNIDFFLAVGGGSVIDATKFIAAAALYEDGDPWDFTVYRGKELIKKAIPIGTVLTLPATGSEMNGNAVVTRVETQEKKGMNSALVMPRFSILDPQCVFTLPERQVANGIADSFIHVMEQYLTFDVNAPLQDRLAESILLTLVEEGPKVLADRNDYDAAANFMWCATMALNGLIGVGVPQDWATHQIGHELTALHGIDHARTLTVVLPGVMDVERVNKKDKILQYGKRIWNIIEGSEDERIDDAIAKTVLFFESLGMPCRLSDYDIPETTIDIIVKRFEKDGVKCGENRTIDFKQVEKILKSRV